MLKDRPTGAICSCSSAFADTCFRQSSAELDPFAQTGSPFVRMVMLIPLAVSILNMRTTCSQSFRDPDPNKGLFCSMQYFVLHCNSPTHVCLSLKLSAALACMRC